MVTNNQISQSSALEIALKKVSSVDVPQGKTIALAYSGGLDSTLCVKLAENKYHAKKLYAISVDVGQGEEEIQLGITRAEQLGITPIILDAKKEFTQSWLTKAIQANSDYNGYPISTSMTRQLIAAIVAKKALELGCDALMEGSSGKGNDQYRMHNVFSLFAPGLSVFVPVRSSGVTMPAQLYPLADVEGNDLRATGAAVVHEGSRPLGSWLVGRYVSPVLRSLAG